MTTISTFEDASLFAPPPQQDSRAELGQEDFLTLMITQFQNQDPFEPMDNGEFLGQLAQFSTVSGIDSLNTGFTDLASAVQGEQALQAASLVGRSVLAVSDTGYLSDSGALDGAVDLGAAAGNVQVDIMDASGQLVRTLDLGSHTAGTVSFSWDGVAADGDRAAAGNYYLNARVVRGAEVESVPTMIEANIDSVTLGRVGEGLTLNLAGGQVLSLSQIHQIT